MKVYKLKQPLHREQVREFARKNQYAMLMAHDATQYYIAARCCLLNRLFVGLTLAAEAVERLLKGFIYLETGQKLNVKGKDAHNPFALKEQLKRARDYKLDKYDDLLKRLYSYFQDRYYDNPNRSMKKSTGELIEIDELWSKLIDLLPMPEELKFRSGTYVMLFEDKDHEGKLLLQNNKFLIQQFPTLEKRYKKVMNILYPPTSNEQKER